MRTTVMSDGSICFGDIPSDLHGMGLAEHLRRAPGFAVNNVIGDAVETWIAFTYKGHSFSAHDTFGSYNLFSETNVPQSVRDDVLAVCRTPSMAEPMLRPKGLLPHLVLPLLLLFSVISLLVLMVWTVIRVW